jgi:hypothetical protein
MSAPIPSSEAGQATTLLFSIACKAVGACAAIGDVGGPDSQSTNHMGLLDTLTGGIWSAATAPLPRSAGPNPHVGMSTLTCASSTSCTAIGHLISGGRVQPFFESLTQGQWSGSIAPLPVACVAVGFYDDPAGTSHAFDRNIWVSVIGAPDPGITFHMAKDLSSTKERKKLSKKSFALPGKRKYPIPDKSHARNALARVAQHGTPAEQKKVKAAVKKRFPSLGKKSHKAS